MTEETNKCTACSCDFTDDEGGVHGDFGILPMSFCPTCLSCMLDMAEQLNPKEWVGLTDEEIWETVSRIGTSDSDVNPYAKLADARAIEAKLRSKNT